MKYRNYIICRASGKIEKMRVPELFDCYTVANRMPHSLMFMEIRARERYWDHGTQETFEGPAVALIQSDKIYKVQGAPKSDREAYALLRSVCPA